MTEAKYSALIIDPVGESKMRLKAATTAVPWFNRVTLVNADREGTTKLDLEPFDVVFVSHRIGKEVVPSFISRAKTLRGGKDAAYVLLMENSQQQGGDVATGILQGADGFLFEPYSVDSLLEITRLAAKVKKQRTFEREKTAMALVVGEIVKQLDLVSGFKRAEVEVGLSMRKLKDMCEFLHTLSPELLEAYYECAVTMFEQARIAKFMTQKPYRGVSSRVKDRMRKKILSETGAKEEVQ